MTRICTQTVWDEWIPLQPGWVWVYLLPYLVGPLVIGFVRPETFRWYIKRGLVVAGLSLICFILVPTKIADRSSDHVESAEPYRNSLRANGGH